MRRLYLAATSLFLIAAALLRLPALLTDNAVASEGLHASEMFLVFLVAIGGLGATLASRQLPGRLGAKRLAFPRIERAAFLAYALGAAAILIGVALRDPELRHPRWLLLDAYDVRATGMGLTPVLLGILAVGISVVLSSFNTLVTVHTLRRPGLTFAKLDAGTWGLYAQALGQAVAAPVLVAMAVAVLAERSFGLGLFTPSRGGDPLLFHHLYWIGVHPLLVTAVLPVLGQALNGLSRDDAPAPAGWRGAMVALVLLAPFGWGQHLLSGVSPYAAMVFSAWALVSLLPFVYLLVTAGRAFRDGLPSPARGALAGVALLVTLAFVIRGLLAGSLATSVGYDVMLFGRTGLDLLLVLAALGLVYAGRARRVAEPAPAAAAGEPVAA